LLDWFDEILISSGIDGIGSVSGITATAGDDDAGGFQLGTIADQVAKAEAVATGHEEIADDDEGFLFLDHLPADGSILRFVNVPARFRQPPAQGGAELLVLIYEQDGLHASNVVPKCMSPN